MLYLWNAQTIRRMPDGAKQPGFHETLGSLLLPHICARGSLFITVPSAGPRAKPASWDEERFRR